MSPFQLFNGGSGITYDSDGQMTGNIPIPGFTGQFIYDAWGRVVKVLDQWNDTLISLSYDATENHAAISSTFTGYPSYSSVYSPSGQVLEDDGPGGNQSPSGPQVSRVTYVWGSVGSGTADLVSEDQTRYNFPFATDRAYMQHDLNFSVTSIVRSDGSVRADFFYDPYGSRSYSGSPTQGDYNIGFQGGQYDSVMGAYKFGARIYLPQLGVWNRQDPTGAAGSGANLYAAMGDSPVTNVDPSGLCSDTNTGLTTTSVAAGTWGPGPGYSYTPGSSTDWIAPYTGVNPNLPPQDNNIVDPVIGSAHGTWTPQAPAPVAPPSSAGLDSYLPDQLSSSWWQNFLGAVYNPTEYNSTAGTVIGSSSVRFWTNVASYTAIGATSLAAGMMAGGLVAGGLGTDAVATWQGGALVNAAGGAVGAGTMNAQWQVASGQPFSVTQFAGQTAFGGVFGAGVGAVFQGAGAFFGAGENAVQDTVPGYRAVSQAEWDQIAQDGQFYSPPNASTPTGNAGKWFYGDQTSAQQFGNFMSQLENAPYGVIQAQLPQSSITFTQAGIDSGYGVTGGTGIFSEYPGLSGVSIVPVTPP